MVASFVPNLLKKTKMKKYKWILSWEIEMWLYSICKKKTQCPHSLVKNIKNINKAIEISWDEGDKKEALVNKSEKSSL